MYINNLNFLKVTKEYLKHLILVFFIIVFFSKEMLINNAELVVIYCLLTFIIFNYFHLRVVINNIFYKAIFDLKNEYKNLSYALNLIEKTLIETLLISSLMFYFIKYLNLLFFKTVNNINKNITINIVNYNLIKIKLMKLIFNISCENKRKLNLYFLKNIKDSVNVDINKPYLVRNKSLKYSD